MKKLLLASIIAACSLPATAENYVDINLDFLTFKASGLDNVSNQVLNFGFGQKLNDNLAIEASLGFGIGDDTVSEEGISATIKTNSLLALNLIGQTPISENLHAQANIGYSRIDAETTANFTYYNGNSIVSGSDSASDSESAFGAGIGLQYTLNQQTNLHANYKYLGKFEEVKISGFRVGASYQF